MGAFPGSSLYYHVGPSSAAPTSYQPSVAGANRRDACHPELDSESVAPPGRFLSCRSEWLARRCRDAPQGWSWTSMSWTGIPGTSVSRPPCRDRVRFRALDALETCVRSMDAPDDQQLTVIPSGARNLGLPISCGSEWLARGCRDAPQGWSWTSMSWTGIPGTCMSRPPCRHPVRFRAWMPSKRASGARMLRTISN